MTTKIVKHKRSLCRCIRRVSLQMIAACGILAGTAGLQSCEKDILEGQPEWLGNSIYERLQDGIELKDGSKKYFNYTLRLMQDLDNETTGKEGATDYVKTLSMTGSKTLFVAPDDAYDAYFKAHNTSYEQLTTAQKKQLFKGSMISNAYLIELMSNTSGNPPEQGRCMRRATEVKVVDNVLTMQPEEFPKNTVLATDPVNKVWESFATAGKPLRVVKDATEAPMVHFLPEFMQKNNITDADLQIISNHRSESTKDSWINGRKVISSEQTCKNGYIYVIDDVMDENLNMAEIINTKPELSHWSQILKRWQVAAPVTGTDLTTFQRLYDTTEPLYAIRYYNNSTNHSYLTLPYTQEEEFDAAASLRFDPGWNTYTADGNTLETDAGAMFVPSLTAFNNWKAGAGSALLKLYGSIDNVPLTTLSQLFNVNMMESFTSSVPSKFTTSVLNDAQQLLGIRPENVEKCYMGCNGVVYVTNQLFLPASFSSVLYPTLIQGDENASDPKFSSMSAIYHAMVGSYHNNYNNDQEMLLYDYKPYLNSMESRFVLVAPYNRCEPSPKTTKSTTPVIRYIDPCSYGCDKQILMEFFFEEKKMQGSYYECKLMEDGSITDLKYKGEIPSSTKTSNIAISDNVIINRLNDYINNAIIVGDEDPTKEYYLTKGGSAMRIFKKGGMTSIQGGLQMETGESIDIAKPEDDRYYMGDKGVGNGVTYGVASGNATSTKFFDLPLTAQNSLESLLAKEHDKYEAGLEGDTIFWNLIYQDPSADKDLYVSKVKPKTVSDVLYTTSRTKFSPCKGTKNLDLFDNFNYTVYVPKDKILAIMTGIDDSPAAQAHPLYKTLPTWEDFVNASSDEEQVFIANRIHDFVRYHVQDNSVFVNGGNINATYETAKVNSDTKKFYTLNVNANASQLTVTDALNNKYTVGINDFCNKPIREYWIQGTPGKIKDKTTITQIKGCSNAVVHKIDGALFYDARQKQDWQSAFRYGAKKSSRNF